MKDTQILANTLQAIAFTQSGTQTIFWPVIFNRAAGIYTFTLWSDRRVKITTFEIRHQGKVVNKQSRPTFQPRGETTFTWDGRKANRGPHQLLVQHEIEQPNSTPEAKSLSLTFEHDPQWFK